MPEDPHALRAIAAGAFKRRLAEPGRASMLENMAARLEARRGEIIAVCTEETALTPEELAPEFDRMTGTLRMFAAVVRGGTWVRASIDRPSPNSIGPNHDIRKTLIPLGPVAVFGSSNFPLAYGVCGGDTASALAAGCPVIVKEHPAHPCTGRLLAEIAHRVTESVWPGALGYLLNEDPSDLSAAQALVQATEIAAVGFTGSVNGGLAIERLARARRIPIPVFAEMGSSNIVMVTRGAAAERGEQIAADLAGSILARYGQQCTNTGVLLIDAPGSSGTARTRSPIIEALRQALLKADPRRMLSARVQAAYTARLSDIAAGLTTGSAVHCPRAVCPDMDPAAPALVEISFAGMKFDDSRYRDEIFGPACIALHVDLDQPDQLYRLLWGLHADAPLGRLVSSVYLSEPVRDQELAAIKLLERLSGRVVFNGVPTGVRVCTSMVHGGPFPATNTPHTTAVGPLAIERWCRPVCYQNCPDALLPPELQDANPRGILRAVNGAPTRDPIIHT